MGTTGKFGTGNTRFAVLILFTGRVERNDKVRPHKVNECGGNGRMVRKMAV